LNGKYETREKKNRLTQLTPKCVSLAAGPKGRDNGAYRIDCEAGSYIEFPTDNGGLDAKHHPSITILFWMYPQNTDGPIFNYKTTSPLGIHMRMVSGKLFAQFTHRNYQHALELITDQPLPLNQWHHVGSSFDDKTRMASLWLNGDQVMKGNIGSGKYSPLGTCTQDYVILGAKGGEGPYFKGRITALGIYEDALTKKEINAISKASQSNLSFNLQLFYRSFEKGRASVCPITLVVYFGRLFQKMG